MTTKRIRSLIALLLAVTMVLSLSPVSAFATVDITGAENHWVAPAAKSSYAYGVLDSLPDEVWQPDEFVSRAEFASMLNNAFGYDMLGVPELTGYKDIPEGEWYADDMSLSIALRYIVGYGYHIAAPEDRITREQAAVMLCKILRLPYESAEIGTQTYFTDIDEVADWAKGAVLTMEQHGYMIGDNGRFRPKSNITNGEAVQLITNVYGTIVDAGLDAQDTVYEKNVTIRQAGVILKNAIIKGDLFITEGVGDGEVWLDTVQVDGRLLVTGGGENSIHVKNVTVNENVVIDKPSVSGQEAVRFHVVQSGDTAIALQGIMKEITITEDMMIVCDMDGGMAVFNLLKAGDGSEKPTVLLAGDVTVEKITAFVPVEIKGDGAVGNIETHTDGIVVDGAIQVNPGNIEAPSGVTVDFGTHIITGEGLSNPKEKPLGTVFPEPVNISDTHTVPASLSAGNSGGSGGNNTGYSGGIQTYYTVTFNANGGSKVASITGIASGGKVSEPTPPIKNGYSFDGWYQDAAYVVPWNFKSDAVNNSVTLYAKWSIISASGDGSLGNPFKIHDVETLQHVGKPTTGGKYDNWTLDKHYVQTADITLPAPDASGNNWEPIGKQSSAAFTGTYDGGGYEIKNLRINTTDDSVGLFGCISGATIKDLGIADCVVNGGTYVGGVTGYNVDGTIEGCRVTGTVSGMERVGGIVGENSGSIAGSANTGNVLDCSVSAVVSGLKGSGGSSVVGGVLGANVGGTVQGCYATGGVSATGRCVGGLAGYTNGIIKDCYATGDVSGDGDVVGGLIGEVIGSLVEYCYAKGNVVGGSIYVGGLTGYNVGSTVIECYATGNVQGTDNVGGIAGYLDNSNQLTNSYATGHVNGKDYVGGVVGSNVGSIIESCYATGDVSGSGSYVGGVVGQNKARSTMDYKISQVRNCVALNSAVAGTQNVGRVAGANDGTSTIENNYAFGGMDIKVNGAPKATVGNDLDSIDGAAVGSESYYKETWWTGYNNWGDIDIFSYAWNPVQWNITDGSLPTLKNVGGVQNPVAPASMLMPLAVSLPAIIILTADAGGQVALADGMSAGLFEIGETVTITAVPDENWQFVCWQDENGEMISADAVFTFEVEGDMMLIALFVEDTQLPDAESATDLDADLQGQEDEEQITPDEESQEGENQTGVDVEPQKDGSQTATDVEPQKDENQTATDVEPQKDESQTATDVKPQQDENQAGSGEKSQYDESWTDLDGESQEAETDM